MKTAELVDAFTRWNERHRAKATVKFYSARLRLFRERFGDRDFATITPLEVDEYLYAAGESKSDSTRRHNAVALQSLQSFALKEKLLERPIFGTLEKPRMGRRERVPTEDEKARLLANAPAPFAQIYNALCQCGARPGELCRLRIEEHIDWSKMLLTIGDHKTARKTGKPRLIPIGKKLATLLKQAIGDRPAGPVFLTAQGAAWTPEHLSSEHRRIRDAAGLDAELVLYLARHRFGTELIRKGLDIKAVADLMGHSSVKTTERYIHRDVTELRDHQDLID